MGGSSVDCDAESVTCPELIDVLPAQAEIIRTSMTQEIKALDFIYRITLFAIYLQKIIWLLALKVLLQIFEEEPPDRILLRCRAHNFRYSYNV